MTVRLITNSFIEEFTVIRGGLPKFFEVHNLLVSKQTLLYFFFNINKGCNVFIVRQRKHARENIVFLSTDLVLDSRIFGESDGLPNSAGNSLKERFSCRITIIVGGNFSQQCSQSLSNCFGDHPPSWSTVTSGTIHLKFDRTTF